MIEKEYLNFFTRFHSHLCLLQGYVYSALKKYYLLKLDLVNISGNKLSNEYFESKF